MGVTPAVIRVTRQRALRRITHLPSCLLSPHSLSSSPSLHPRLCFPSRPFSSSSFDDSIDDDSTPLPSLPRKNLHPSHIVAELDKHIVGQAAAKRAVATALRNRWRRHHLPASLRNDVTPKNILMIGPTGCGKTEIARRLAKITDSPFIKVEATKFTEVGFFGRDVDSIIKDLARQTVPELKAKRKERYQEKVSGQVEDAILDAVMSRSMSTSTRDEYREQLKKGELETMEIEIEVPPASASSSSSSSSSSDPPAVIVSILSGSGKPFLRSTRKLLPVSEARPILTEVFLSKLISNEDLSKLAVKAIEESGIVFLDEIDKVCTPSSSASFRASADASAEGVQRDLLPLIEGSAISTPIGTINTDHILFICSGAFHAVKPSDLLPELQGRLPVKVELKGLEEEDLYRILTVPVTNLLMQQAELLKAEGIELEFSEAAVREIARVTAEVNRQVENIGARRLNTVISRIMEEVSFAAADMPKGTKVRIEKEEVVEKVRPLMEKGDLTKYIL